MHDPLFYFFVQDLLNSFKKMSYFLIFVLTIINRHRMVVSDPLWSTSERMCMSCEEPINETKRSFASSHHESHSNEYDDCVENFANTEHYITKRINGSSAIPDDDARIVDVAGADLGVPQLLDVQNHDQILGKLDEARFYIADFVNLDEFYVKVRDICKNKHELCGLWASTGECQKNSAYMRSNCAPVCMSCEDMHVETKCAIDPAAPLAWGPGDLNRMFERIATEPELQRFEPKVLSRPNFVNGDTQETADYQLGPWVVVLEDFLTDDECERLIQLGADQGYNRSSDVGEQLPDGSFADLYYSGRTSTNSWCFYDCMEDEEVQQVMAKMYRVTLLDDKHAEYLQLLRYEEGQFYERHHDYIPTQKVTFHGVRILTVFLYLGDVEEGGGTNFPLLDLTVMPKKGRALIWPSVLDEAPNNVDQRTEHQALPVTTGIKHAANAWYHNRDFKIPDMNGCG